MRLLANIIYLIELLAGAPQLAVRRAARAGREAQARQPHHVVHDDERLGREQRVGAKHLPSHSRCSSLSHCALTTR